MKAARLDWPRAGAVLASVVTAVVLAGLLVLATGKNPVEVFWQIVVGSIVGTNFQHSVARAVPLVGMALAVALPLRAGLVNLGGDGQLLFGAMAAAIAAVYLPAPGVIQIVFALVAAMLAGGAYASIAAFLQTALRVPFLVGSLLLSYIAIGVTSYIARFPLRDPASGLPETRRIAPAARLPNVLLGLPISAGLIIMVLVIILIVFNDKWGVIGLEMRMRGLNPAFARYTGVDLPRQTIAIAAVSGGIAGLVGALIILGEQYRFTDGAILAANYTWSGLLAAILAMASPIATITAAAFFAFLQVGGFSVERALGLPNVLTQIIQALIILGLALRGGIARRQ